MQGNSTGYNHKARKRFGQNFLIDDTVIDGILAAADLSKEDTVLEIGPGKGALTGRLLEGAKEVIAVEIDWDLAALLEEEFSGRDNFSLIQGDILKIDLQEVLSGKENLKIVANLPYYITTPIMMKLFESGIAFDRMVVMVQREVALRMCAKKSTPDYGALSLAVNFYTKPKIAIEVKNTSFRPVPKVDSCVVTLRSKPWICDEKERDCLFKYIKAAFSQRRKTLLNSLSAGGLASKEEVKEALLKMGLKETVRGEALDLEEFLTLIRNIKES